MLEQESTAMVNAVREDLHKHESESMIMEVDYVKNDAIYTLNHLKEWMKPEAVKKNLFTMMDSAYIKYEPLGVTLVIGAWNFPVQLALGPMVGAIAAGNCVVLKPSEVSVNTCKVLERVCHQYLDPDCVRVVNGGVPETTELLKERFDHIMYTGNSQVARIVYEAAAKHLTPVTLELGGKSPVYIDESSDLDIVARRVLWGKFVNAGQVCIAPDYIMCSPDMQNKFVEKCKIVLQAFFTDNPAESQSFGRVVNERHFKRISALLAASSGRVVIGGSSDAINNYIEPTILADVKPDDAIMKDEIFGPLLPIMTVQNVDEAIRFINSGEKPLAMYIFSKNKATVKKILSSTSSGGVTVNDTLMHQTLHTLPFGGVGSSGMGSYHGKFSFLAFSHKRACLERDQKMEKLNDLRYPPYSPKKHAIVTWFLKEKVHGPFKKIWSYAFVLTVGILLGVAIKVLIELA